MNSAPAPYPIFHIPDILSNSLRRLRAICQLNPTRFD